MAAPAQKPSRLRGTAVVLILCSLFLVCFQFQNFFGLDASLLYNDMAIINIATYQDLSQRVINSTNHPARGFIYRAAGVKNESLGGVNQASFPVRGSPAGSHMTAWWTNATAIKLAPLKPPPGTKGKNLNAWSTELKTPYLISASLHHNGHFQTVGGTLARTYKDQPRFKFCQFQQLIRADKKQTHNTTSPIVYVSPAGLFYNKVPKAASTTLAAVNNRIALRQKDRMKQDNSFDGHQTFSAACTHSESHISGARRFYGNRNPERSFLWGSIRDPASRALSRVFFFQISQAGREATDETILYCLKNSFNPQSGTTSPGKGGFQAQYMAMDKIADWSTYSKSYPTVVQRPDLLLARVAKIMDNYDFLAVTERMDESLVTLQLILGLPVGDILTSSAKTGGGFTYKRHKNGTVYCIAIQKTFRSPTVQEYLTSDEWHAVNYADYILYAAANRSLDLTIQRLGKTRFEKALQQFRQAKKVIDQQCRGRVFPPCSANGTEQVELSRNDCYKHDEGCGFPCIDDVSLENGW